VNNAEFTSRGHCCLLLSTQYVTTGDKAGAASFIVICITFCITNSTTLYMAGIMLICSTSKSHLYWNQRRTGNADDDDDDVVDIRCGLTETGSVQLSLMIYAAFLCSRLCVHGSQLQTKKHKLVKISCANYYNYL